MWGIFSHPHTTNYTFELAIWHTELCYRSRKNTTHFKQLYCWRFTKSISKLHYLPYTTRLYIQPQYIYQLFLVAVLILISALSTASCITIPAWIHFFTSLFVLNPLVVIHLLSSNHLWDLTLVNFLISLVLLTFGILYHSQLSMQALSLLSNLAWNYWYFSLSII